MSILVTAVRFAGKDGAGVKAVENMQRQAQTRRGGGNGLTDRASELAAEVVTNDSGAGAQGDGHTMIRYPEPTWAQEKAREQARAAQRVGTGTSPE